VSQPKKILSLKRLIIANSTFDAVADACKFLITSDVDENAPYYRIFTAGISVSYMRPFRSSDGLGTLPQYEKFPSGTEYAKPHEDLKKARDSVFAHYSAKDAHLLVTPEKQEEVRDIQLDFDENGDPRRFVVKSINWSRGRLHAIISLCEFQASRIGDEAVGLIKHLGKGKTYRGTHVLGKTFP
jgi:hypothetical protein